MSERRHFAGGRNLHHRPNKCTECVGHFDTPQCVEVCPVDCIPLNPDYPETKAQLQEKFLRLTADK